MIIQYFMLVVVYIIYYNVVYTNCVTTSCTEYAFVSLVGHQI